MGTRPWAGGMSLGRRDVLGHSQPWGLSPGAQVGDSCAGARSQPLDVADLQSPVLALVLWQLLCRPGCVSELLFPIQASKEPFLPSCCFTRCSLFSASVVISPLQASWNCLHLPDFTALPQHQEHLEFWSHPPELSQSLPASCHPQVLSASPLLQAGIPEGPHPLSCSQGTPVTIPGLVTFTGLHSGLMILFRLCFWGFPCVFEDTCSP